MEHLTGLLLDGNGDEKTVVCIRKNNYFKIGEKHGGRWLPEPSCSQEEPR